jgi:mannitol/fructose-specific phosphotransferase system IIA component (Ntr-type)
MNLKKALKDTCISINLRSSTKHGVIKEMVDMMIAAGKIKDKDRQAVLTCVMERERKMSTGLQCGIAIPHGKTAAIDRLVTAFALKKDGMDFGSQDGQPSRIFVMTISSINYTGPHMEYLAEISKLLDNHLIRQRVLGARTEEDIVGILTNEQS